MLKWNFFSYNALPCRVPCFKDSYSFDRSFLNVWLDMLLKFFKFTSKCWVFCNCFRHSLFSINSYNFYKLMLYFFKQLSALMFSLSLCLSDFLTDFLWLLLTYSGFYFFFMSFFFYTKFTDYFVYIWVS